MDGKSVYYNRLANIGILRIGDLIYEDNKLLTNHLRELNISPLDAFRLTCVIDALPTEWRAFLKTCNHSVIEPFNLQNQVQLHLHGQNVLLGKAESKLIYKEIRNRSITPPTHSSSSSRLGHKAATKLRHTDLSRALACASPHERPISSSSFITVLRQVVFGLPLFLLPDGVHFIATLGILSSDILST